MVVHSIYFGLSVHYFDWCVCVLFFYRKSNFQANVIYGKIWTINSDVTVLWNKLVKWKLVRQMVFWVHGLTVKVESYYIVRMCVRVDIDTIRHVMLSENKNDSVILSMYWMTNICAVRRKDINEFSCHRRFAAGVCARFFIFSFNCPTKRQIQMMSIFIFALDTTKTAQRWR